MSGFILLYVYTGLVTYALLELYEWDIRLFLGLIVCILIIHCAYILVAFCIGSD